MEISSALIVDDNEGDRYLLKRQLKDIGLCEHIFEADDGKTALEFLQKLEENRLKYEGKFPPVVIFLDINMPHIDGFQFLKEFDEIKKNINEYESIVLMMFTSSQRDEDTKKALSYDCVKGFITKGSLDLDQLRNKVISSLETV